MSISRRDLLAKVGLAIPAAAVLAVATRAEAETTTGATPHSKHKGHHKKTASNKHHHRTAQNRTPVAG